MTALPQERFAGDAARPDEVLLRKKVAQPSGQGSPHMAGSDRAHNKEQ